MANSNVEGDQSPDKSNDLWKADQQIGRYILTAMFVIIVLLFGAGGWAATTQINGAVIASGELKVQSFSKSVQHLEGGLIKEIRVKDGDRVSAGDVLLRLDEAELQNQIRAEESQALSKENQIELLRSELEDLEKLAKKGLVQKPRLTSLERQIESLLGEKEQHHSSAMRFSSRLERLEVRAPIDGVIHSLAFHTLRGVIAPGEEILKIVPQTEQLFVEARVSPKDIDQVSPDQQAVVRLSSFNRNITPEADARITHVSADLSRDEARDLSYYVVHLEIDNRGSESMNGVALMPGMPADVFISTDERTVLSYLVKPLSDQFQRAFRE